MLTNQYSPNPNEESEGCAGQKIESQQLASIIASKTALAKDCKQTTVSKGQKEALLKAWDCPRLDEMKNR